MTSTWQILIGNVAVVMLVVVGWGHARTRLYGLPGAVRSALFGATMGVGAVATMVMSAEFAPGMHIDMRATLLAVSAFFGGPLAAGISGILALAWRIGMGGAGLTPGIIVIVMFVLVGLGGRLLVGRRGPAAWHCLVLGIATALVWIGALVIFAPGPTLPMLINVGLPQALLNVVATGLAGVVFLQARRRSAERDLLAAALAQSPDFNYIKDHEGRFAAVNNTVAEFNGFARPEDMIGKTDFDLMSAERAQATLERERAILAGDTPMLDFEELFVDRTGRERCFSTSKVPLHNAAGQIIGLAGVTRDITVDKRLRQELVESRDTLSYALAEMSDGLAVFDAEGRLVFCNEQYRACFPHTGKLRQPGAYLRDILQAVVETDEQITVPRHNPEAWIDAIVANLAVESEEEINLFDGRWLQLRTRPTSSGSTMVVVADVTRMKLAELALHTTTNKLKELVRTDSLTDLLNRRAFDEAIETETRRSARAGTAFSLLLVDVDQFKAYNDHYGHPAGDECLRLVSQHLKASLKRPGDLAARYGGEEFTAILPDTDADSAYLVAEGFRRALAEARLPHETSERGYLTASVGVATYMPENVHRDALELVRAADEALYSAKGAGRDRVFGTRIAGKGRAGRDAA
ncbi:diguanylate cyclase [Devosia sp.]|uniref:diguanylate cyclase n=1 Tax=Devosia sp. TaxID=1871048 RepID=UPI002FC7E2D9